MDIVYTILLFHKKVEGVELGGCRGVIHTVTEIQD